jgi:soluble lytic murein transglycosylase-like protein
VRRLAAVLAVILGMGGIAAAPTAGSAGTPTASDLREQLAAERHAAASTERALRRELRRARRAHAEPVEEALRPAAAIYGVPLGELRSVAWCESRLRPWARNASGASGLLQFMPGTFAGTPPGRAGLSPFSPYANALAAGWLVSRGGWGPWTCRP